MYVYILLCAYGHVYVYMYDGHEVTRALHHKYMYCMHEAMRVCAGVPHTCGKPAHTRMTACTQYIHTYIHICYQLIGISSYDTTHS